MTCRPIAADFVDIAITPLCPVPSTLLPGPHRAEHLHRRPAHCQCAGCGLTLAYAGDAQFVRCAACEHVTRVGGGENREENRSAPHAPSPFGGGAGRASAMVVVENPPTLDHAGTPRSNMAVGVVSED